MTNKPNIALKNAKCEGWQGLNEIQICETCEVGLLYVPIDENVTSASSRSPSKFEGVVVDPFKLVPKSCTPQAVLLY